MTGELNMFWWLFGTGIFLSLFITFVMFQVWDSVDNINHEDKE